MECRYAECHYAECRYAECHYDECRCLYTECGDANDSNRMNQIFFRKRWSLSKIRKEFFTTMKRTSLFMFHVKFQAESFDKIWKEFKIRECSKNLSF